MKLILDGIYSKHIFFYIKMLGKKEDVIEIKNYSDSSSKILLPVLHRVKTETGCYLTMDMLNNMIQTAYLSNTGCVAGSSPVVIDCNNLEGLEEKIFKILYPYLSYNTFDPETIEYTIKLMFKREISKNELSYHTRNNVKGIDMFTWMLILHQCVENIERAERIERIENIENQTKSKKIAIILCGHVRNFKHNLSSQKKFINNASFDVFIHTWDDTGLKNTKHNIIKEWLNPNTSKIDIESIRLNYQPKKMKVENNKELFDKLSLKKNLNPIFLFKYQAQDDASKYINSQLYSIYEGYKLIEEYERENNMRYDGILKLRFDFNLNSMNINNIMRHIEVPAVWWPHCKSSNHGHHGGGGGCQSCDLELKHSDHTNDLCDVWFYANRELGQKTCEVFLEVENIMRDNHEKNLQILKDKPFIKYEAKDGFIYIEKFEDIEKHIVCMYPERLNRMHLKNIKCLSSMAITGRII